METDDENSTEQRKTKNKRKSPKNNKKNKKKNNDSDSELNYNKNDSDDNNNSDDDNIMHDGHEYENEVENDDILNFSTNPENTNIFEEEYHCSRWYLYYLYALHFIRCHGHCNVPPAHPLTPWVQYTKQKYFRNELQPEEKKDLISFLYNTGQLQWEWNDDDTIHNHTVRDMTRDTIVTTDTERIVTIDSEELDHTENHVNDFLNHNDINDIENTINNNITDSNKSKNECSNNNNKNNSNNLIYDSKYDFDLHPAVQLNSKFGFERIIQVCRLFFWEAQDNNVNNIVNAITQDNNSINGDIDISLDSTYSDHVQIHRHKDNDSGRYKEAHNHMCNGDDDISNISGTDDDSIQKHRSTDVAVDFPEDRIDACVYNSSIASMGRGNLKNDDVTDHTVHSSSRRSDRLSKVTAVSDDTLQSEHTEGRTGKRRPRYSSDLDDHEDVVDDIDIGVASSIESEKKVEDHSSDDDSSMQSTSDSDDEYSHYDENILNYSYPCFHEKDLDIVFTPNNFIASIHTTLNLIITVEDTNILKQSLFLPLCQKLFINSKRNSLDKMKVLIGIPTVETISSVTASARSKRYNVLDYESMLLLYNFLILWYHLEKAEKIPEGYILILNTTENNPDYFSSLNPNKSDIHDDASRRNSSGRNSDIITYPIYEWIDRYIESWHTDTLSDVDRLFIGYLCKLGYSSWFADKARDNSNEKKREKKRNKISSVHFLHGRLQRSSSDMNTSICNESSSMREEDDPQEKNVAIDHQDNDRNNIKNNYKNKVNDDDSRSNIEKIIDIIPLFLPTTITFLDTIHLYCYHPYYVKGTFYGDVNHIKVIFYAFIKQYTSEIYDNLLKMESRVNDMIKITTTETETENEE